MGALSNDAVWHLSVPRCLFFAVVWRRSSSDAAFRGSIFCFLVVPVKWLVIIGHVNRSFYLLTYGGRVLTRISSFLTLSYWRNCSKCLRHLKTKPSSRFAMTITYELANDKFHEQLCAWRHNMPLPLYAGRCGPAAAHPYACGAQCALLPVAVGAMNIHDVRDRRQTDDRRRQTRIIA